MYLEILDSEEANVVAIEVNQLTSLLVNVPTLPINVIEEGGKFYVQSVDQYDYSRRTIENVLTMLPSQNVQQIITGSLIRAADFGRDLIKRFTAENIATGISQNAASVAGVVEAMNRKYIVDGCKDDGVSLNDILNTNSLTVGPAVIDAMLEDLNDNPEKFEHITLWINAQRLNQYKADIVAYLFG